VQPESSVERLNHTQQTIAIFSEHYYFVATFMKIIDAIEKVVRESRAVLCE
jgi:hypothetical protein